MTIVDIAQLTASFAAAIGLFLVAWQTREATKSRHLQATLDIFNDLGSDENRSLRRFVWNELPTNPAKFSDDTLAKVERLCGALERTALLVNAGFVEKHLVERMYVEAIVKCWNKLTPYIDHARKSRGQQYMMEFETLAKEVRKYSFKRLHGKPLL
jgi:hypothetical protein